MMTRADEPEIYRGYHIYKHPVEGYVVRKDGKTVTSQPSLEFCYKWIDREHRNEPS